MSTLYLVRHAKAGDRDAWEGDDRERPLTKKGRQQAQRLVALLRGHGVQRVLSSPYVRCTQTVEPFADALGTTIEPTDILAEGSPLGQVYTLLRDVAQAPAVLCTHGDVIADIIVCLAETGTPGVDGLRWKKGSTWVLTMSDGVVSRAEYVPPPS